MKLRLTEELWREGNMYVAYCPELDIPSCGNSVEQAKSNLREVIVIHLEEAEKQGRLSEFLDRWRGTFRYSKRYRGGSLLGNVFSEENRFSVSGSNALVFYIGLCGPFLFVVYKTAEVRQNPGNSSTGVA